jgi:hypothetical protein
MAETYEMGKGVSITSRERGANAGINDLETLHDAVKEGFTANDQRDMQRMGKKQEFRRNFHFLTTVGFTCCVVCRLFLRTRDQVAGESHGTRTNHSADGHLGNSHDE